MNDNMIYMGVNAPKEHQRVIRKLTAELGTLYKDQKISYEPFPETMIDESSTSAVPDILLFDNNTNLNVMIVEITTTTAMKSDFEKVGKLCDRYEVQEGFAYDYQSKKWRKYKLGIGEVANDPSYCDVIGMDLNGFL